MRRDGKGGVQGNAVPSDVWVDQPEENVGQPLHFLVKVGAARGLPVRFTDVFAKYKVRWPFPGRLPDAAIPSPGL